MIPMMTRMTDRLAFLQWNISTYLDSSDSEFDSSYSISRAEGDFLGIGAIIDKFPVVGTSKAMPFDIRDVNSSAGPRLVK